jgi:hypothetical protein
MAFRYVNHTGGALLMKNPSGCIPFILGQDLDVVAEGGLLTQTWKKYIDIER